MKHVLCSTIQGKLIKKITSQTLIVRVQKRIFLNSKSTSVNFLKIIIFNLIAELIKKFLSNLEEKHEGFSLLKIFSFLKPKVY